MRFNYDWALPLILIWNSRRNVNWKHRQLGLMHSPSVELVYNKSLSITFRKSFLFLVCSMWSCFISLEPAISKALGIPAVLSKKQFIIVLTWEIWQIIKKQILFMVMIHNYVTSYFYLPALKWKAAIPNNTGNSPIMLSIFSVDLCIQYWFVMT